MPHHLRPDHSFNLLPFSTTLAIERAASFGIKDAAAIDGADPALNFLEPVSQEAYSEPQIPKRGLAISAQNDGLSRPCRTTVRFSFHSGHSAAAPRITAVGHNPTFAVQRTNWLFDHLVGAQH
jgi:hypothetical protein